MLIVHGTLTRSLNTKLDPCLKTALCHPEFALKNAICRSIIYLKTAVGHSHGLPLPTEVFRPNSGLFYINQIYEIHKQMCPGAMLPRDMPILKPTILINTKYINTYQYKIYITHILEVQSSSGVQLLAGGRLGPLGQYQNTNNGHYTY